MRFVTGSSSTTKIRGGSTASRAHHRIVTAECLSLISAAATCSDIHARNSASASLGAGDPARLLEPPIAADRRAWCGVASSNRP